MAHVTLDHGEAFDRGIQHEETKQLCFFNVSSVPVEKVWTFDAALLPWDSETVNGNVGIPVVYKVKNAQSAGLCQHALRGGKVRVYQEDGHGGTILLGEDAVPLVPVGEDMEACNLKYERKDASTLEFMVTLPPRGQENLTMHDHRRDLPVKVEITRNFPTVHWDLTPAGDHGTFAKVDVDTVKFSLELDARANSVFTYALTTRFGRRANP
ncbi:MAG: hypothetical protein O3B24_11295 [Verrucomicrobia bacterium]|nr:hypothetical protein [Verrucomicrobiota bacterium]